MILLRRSRKIFHNKKNLGVGKVLVIVRVFRLGELFAGAGGLAWGALHAENHYGKIVHAWANDYDAFTCDTYRKNICPEEFDSVVCCDVRKLRFGGTKFPNRLAYFAKRI